MFVKSAVNKTFLVLSHVFDMFLYKGSLGTAATSPLFFLRTGAQLYIG